MEGKDAIINSILTGANNAAANILRDANEERERILEKTRNELEANSKRQLEIAKLNADDIERRRISLAELDARKIRLSYKQGLIDSVYSSVIQKFNNMTDNIYRDFMGTLALKYMENDDEVIVAESDKKRLNEDWVKGLAKKKGINLNYGKTYHEFRGGVILKSKYVDKNITLETLVKEIRPLTEADTAKRLFDDKNN